MALKDRVISKFPAVVNAATGLGLSVANGVFNFFFDFTKFLKLLTLPDANLAMVMVYTPDPTDPNINGQYNLMSVADFIGSASLKVQTVTTASAAILSSSNIVLVNQTTPGPSTLTLPLAASKSGAVLIVDWRGDASTNNITVVPSGAETFQGGLTSWKLVGDGASVSLRPVPQIGYAV